MSDNDNIIPLRRPQIEFIEDVEWQSVAHMLAEVLYAIHAAEYNPLKACLMIINDDGTYTILRQDMSREEARELFRDYVDAVKS